MWGPQGPLFLTNPMIVPSASLPARTQALSTVRSGSIPIWFGALVVAALWMLARPYIGLRHDGILYVGQALLHLLPQTMSRDVFFAYGSQDSFTLVSSLLAALYLHLGVDVVQIAVPTLCHVALLAAAFLLLRPLPDIERWLGLAAVAALSHIYGGFGTFAYAERFVTGRTLAEPLALLFLVLLVVRRGGWSVAALCAAAAMHPLVTLPATVIGWLFLCTRDRRWGWAALAVLLPVGLGLLGIAPFSHLFDRYDEVWEKAVGGTTPQVLISTWTFPDWQTAAADLALLAVSARLLPAPLARLALAAFGATIVLVAVSYTGADLLHNVLITQLQVWRVLWLAHLLAQLFLPALGFLLWRRDRSGQLAVLALAAAVLAVNALWELGWVFGAWAAITLGLMASRQPLSAATHRLAMASTWLALAALSGAVTMRAFGMVRVVNPVVDLPTVLLVAFTLPTLALPLAGALFWAWRQGRLAALLALAVAAATATCGAVAWDRRSAWVRYIETSLPSEHPFDRVIPAGAQVYWHDNLAATWLVLKRPSYYSKGQGAGVLFNRPTMVEFMRRHEAFRPLEMQDQLCQMMAALNEGQPATAPCSPTLEIVELLCRIPQGPDFLIFEPELGKGIVASWTFGNPGQPDRTYHLYDCSRLR